MPIEPGRSLTMSAKLSCACGITLSRRASTDGGSDRWPVELAELLTYWLNDRTDLHRCSLVSEENPLGLTCKYGTKGRPHPDSVPRTMKPEVEADHAH